MTKSTMTLREYLRNVGVDSEGDFLSEGARLVAHLVIELEVEEIIVAVRCERSPKRRHHRNDTCLGNKSGFRPYGEQRRVETTIQ